MIRQWECLASQLPVERVPVGALLPAQSPRSKGESAAHVRVLAESTTALPPILVHRSTMRVIDGMHRLRVAALRGDGMIDVRFFDGDIKDVFPLAVRANVAHGLALSLADRKAAAVSVIESHPQWSDRLIALTTGLSHKTIGALRQLGGGGGPDSGVRLGQDGKLRPVDQAAGRTRAAELIRADPGASPAAVARRAGVSPTTVRDVRARLRRGDDPVPAHCHTRAPERNEGEVDAGVPRHEVLMRRLRDDPALRFSESGRALLRALSISAGAVSDCERLAQTVPPHCLPAVIELSRQHAQMWAAMAQLLACPARGAATA